MKTKLLLVITFMFSGFLARGTNITVPGSFNSIQHAINAATNGDTIIVSPGIYFENINFRGKNVVLTSLYYMNSDISYIASTIINGSNPAFSDTASCVIFNSWEDSTAVLQGFTITGGAGTKWLDPHGAGIYREGGGVLIDFSSPTIKHNLIIGNAITDMTGVISTGGAGIRVGDGNPEICNNVITGNEARYGAGIVLNYTGCKIRNNVIVNNTGGQDYYGGSAIWINNNMPVTPKIIENNTIANNLSVSANGTGGIVAWSAADVEMKNNIVYGNFPAVQIKAISSAPMVSHSDIEGGYAGQGNIDADPMFSPVTYMLQAGSPCIDAGNVDPLYYDKEDSGNPGSAMYPSGGTVINDMGAYGGPTVTMFPYVATTVGVNEIVAPAQFSFFPNPASTSTTLTTDKELVNATAFVYDNTGSLKFVFEKISGKTFDIDASQWAAGIYFVKLIQSNTQLHTAKIVVQK